MRSSTNWMMTLRKWRSSSTELLESIPKELRETSNLDISLSPAEQGKALGLHWDTIQDCLYISTHNIDSKLLATKRRVSSAIAKTFDVMGWCATAVLPGKLLFQEVWTLDLAWHDPLPDTL